MLIETHAARVRKAVRTVLRRIPVADRRRIESFVVWARAEREWCLIGVGGRLDRRSAALMPLYDSTEMQGVPRAQIIFWLPVCRLFSDHALLGVAAHELAHAIQATGFRGDWHERMQRRYDAGERDADRIATNWGFGSQIQALRRERRETVDPFLDAHEDSFVRSIMQKATIQNEAAGRRMSQLAGGI